MLAYRYSTLGSAQCSAAAFASVFRRSVRVFELVLLADPAGTRRETTVQPSQLDQMIIVILHAALQ